MIEHDLFTLLDLSGTFAFAISGALAARQNKLDAFGVVTLAYLTACGGGLVRDVSIGALPPAGIADWRYIALSLLAAVLVMGASQWVRKLSNPVLLFDAAGLSFFAVFGAHKVLAQGYGVEPAILLGMISAVGGGALRDIILRRTPIILRKEIYATAALVAATIQTLGEVRGWPPHWVPWVAIALCFGLRYLAVRNQWDLPRFTGDAGRGRKSGESR